jgi:ribosomal protein L37E
MSDLLNNAAILSETVLKSCKRCGHSRSHHPQNKECTVEGCNCPEFVE